MLRRRHDLNQEIGRNQASLTLEEFPDVAREAPSFSRQSEAASYQAIQDEGHEFCITVHRRESNSNKSSPSHRAHMPFSGTNADGSIDGGSSSSIGIELGGRKEGRFRSMHGVMRQASPYMIGMLCTGCSLALLSQHMANQGMIMNKAQMPAWTRCTLNFLISLCVELGTAAAGGWSRSRPWTASMSSDRSSRTYLSVPPPGMSMRQTLALSVIG